MGAEQPVSTLEITKVLFLLFVTCLVQSIVSNHLHVFGYVPDAFLCVVAMIGLFGGVWRGLWLGFLFGLVADLLFHSTPFALSAVQLALVGYATGLVRGAMLRSVHWVIPIVVFLASAGGVILFSVVGATLGRSYLLSWDLPLMIVVVSLMNAILAAPLYPLVRWAVAPEERTGLAVVRG